MRPSPRTTPDAWAAAHRRYPKTAGKPGKRDPFLTPMVVPFGRAMAEGHRYKRVVQVCAAQMGKTDTLLDVIGERLDHKPAPILYVGPSRDFCTDQFEPRLMALLDQASSLAEKVARGKRMKKTRKIVAGVPVRLAHGGSSTALKSDPAAIAFIDEYDELLRNVRGQGDPLGLVEARGDTYADFVTGVVSTPSLGALDTYVDRDSGLEFWKEVAPEDLQSKIWKLWQEGTRYHWAWPCPHCAEYFIPRFSCLKWAPRDDGGKVTPLQARRSAYVECPRCGGVIDESHKKDLNARGRYVAPGQSIAPDGVVTGEPPESSTLSFWCSGLASPFVSFGERAERYLKAVRAGGQEPIQTAINAGFGELFSPGGGDVPEWAEVAEHKAEYQRGELPAGAVFLVLTVDVQKNRLVYVIRGWGGRATSWLIDWGMLYGETVEEGVWTDLADLMKTPVAGVPIRMVLIDSGFRPGKRDDLPLNRIYDFCRRFPRLVRPTKGSSSPMRLPLVKSRIEVTARANANKYGLELIRLDTDHWKSFVHERVRWPSDQPGAWHLPCDVDDDYCKQIISEARIRLASGAPRWVRRSKENHFLDCEAMQAAASHLLNAQRIPVGFARPAPKHAAPAPTQQMQQPPNTIAGPEADDPSAPRATAPERHSAFGEQQPSRQGYVPRRPGWFRRD
jgi:phage terminase large subunit GpA-like protein